MSAVFDWIRSHDALLWWLTAASVATFVATLIAVPMLIVRIPTDYFAHGKRHRVPWAEHHPVVRALLLTGKNVLGVLFIGAGLAMLLLPGQGVLTMLIGVMLLSFPGKYRFERWLARRGPVRRSINWLRRRTGHPPLILDEIVD